MLVNKHIFLNQLQYTLYLQFVSNALVSLLLYEGGNAVQFVG